MVLQRVDPMLRKWDAKTIRRKGLKSLQVL